ncbi:hypothetical protein J9A65_04720, partial [Klebsiella pneumoniae]
FVVGGPVGDSELLLCHGMVCVVGRMRDLILQLSKSSIYSTKPDQPDTFVLYHSESIASNAVVSESFLANYVAFIDLSGILIILQYFFAASHLVRVSASEMFG